MKNVCQFLHINSVWMCRCMSKTNQVDVYENNLGLVHVKLNKKNYFYENNERGNILTLYCACSLFCKNIFFIQFYMNRPSDQDSIFEFLTNSLKEDDFFQFRRRY